MDNQRLKNFLTENTRRTAVLRIPGFIMILLSVILAFMPGFIFFYISIATLIAGVIYILIVIIFIASVYCMYRGFDDPFLYFRF